MVTRSPPATDAVVIGGGLVGLAVADALAGRGITVTLVAEPRPGESSAAGAGMLAPTLEPFDEPVRGFAIASRDRFPRYLRSLEERTGIVVPLDRAGILEVALGGARADRLRAEARGDVQWLDAQEVAEIEPSLAPVLGALFHPLDGAVDNVLMLRALQRSVELRREVRVVEGAAVALEYPSAHAFGPPAQARTRSAVAVRLADGRTIEGDLAVLAAGAWSAQIDGLPRALPVEPARGQMVAMQSSALGHVVFADDAYLVPRPDGRALVGATMERVGFDDSTTPEALDRLRDEARRLVPALRDAPVVAGWAGLRPMAPDGLPILGRDPDWPALVYACGHSRNGILMAPLTGDVVASLALDEEPQHDLSAFSIERFPRGTEGATP